jgi:putative oxidoreductase
MARAKSAFLSLAASLENMSHAASLEKWRPQALSVLRIVVALLFLQSGFEKFFGFPPGPQLAGVIILAAAIETIGLLLQVGLFSRWVAFVMSGEMAFAYFMVHAPKSIYPAVNGGNLAVLYSFVFLYLSFAGPGPWSLDHTLKRE